MKTIMYKNYRIEPTGDDYRVCTADGKLFFSDIAASVKTAKKWIDAILAERAYRRYQIANNK